MSAQAHYAAFGAVTAVGPVRRAHPNSVGLAVAAFLATWHLLWVLLVATGAAQPVLDFVFFLHMITPPYKVAGFEFSTAVGLVLMTAGLGYVMGACGAIIWNRLVAREH